MYKRTHHQTIEQILSHFNSDYLTQNNILFGGGTRIALELCEYRESVDIDFLCMNTASYKAVRTQVTNESLGELLIKPLEFRREIRIDRNAVRTFINMNGIAVKLEFVAFDDYKLQAYKNSLFNVPCIDQDSCYTTKLLAHSDRKYSDTRKDFFDLLMMYRQWGLPHKSVWQESERHYGAAPKKDLIEQLQQVDNNIGFLKLAGKKLDIKAALTEELLTTVKSDFLENL